MSRRRRRNQNIGLKLAPEALEKIKIVSDYLFFDQYKDMASFPRFEECFGVLTVGKNIDLPEVFKQIVGEKKKYITFRRMIRMYYRIQEGGKRLSENTKTFFDDLYNKTLISENEGYGNHLEHALHYQTNNAENHYAISKLSVITDESGEQIIGIRLYYDDFFKNDLFLNKGEEEYVISLEINLGILEERPEELKEQFPDINGRDGITNVLGTYTDHVTFLGFKCRSGKTLFIGKPEGNPFLFGVIGKQVQGFEIEIYENKITFIKPRFQEVIRTNPHVDKDESELTEDYVNNDKPIYEEEMLKSIKDEKTLEKNILQPLIPDDAFFNPKFKDKVRGVNYAEVCPLVKRFWHRDPETGKGKIKIDPKALLGEAEKFIVKQAKKKNDEKLRGKKGGGGIGGLIGSAVGGLFGGNNNEEKSSPASFLLDSNKFDSLLSTFSDSIAKGFGNSNNDNNEKKSGGLLGNVVGGVVGGIGSMLSGNKGNNADDDGGDLQGKRKKKKGGFGIASLFDSDGGSLQQHFNDVTDNLFGFFGDSGNKKKKQQQPKQQQLTQEQLKISYTRAQNNWKKLGEKLSKDQGIFILQTIGMVVKALKLLDDENKGKKTNYTMAQKVQMLETLRNNRPIVNMLSKAHKEALRRDAEASKLKEDEAKLEEMRIKEEKRKQEERKRLEEEKRRREEEKRIEEEKKRIEEERKKREEEERKRQIQIQIEQDRQRRLELQRIEEQKRREAEIKRQQEEARQRELERQQKILEEQRRKAEEEQRRKEEEERRRQEEEQRRKEEEERRRQEEEEAQRKSEVKQLNVDDLPIINSKIEQLQNMINKASGEKKQQLQDYLNELQKDKNAIVELLNKEEKNTIAKELGYDAQEALKKEEEERKRLKEEEEKKILEKQKEEEEKQKQQTQIVSIKNVEIPKDVKIYRNQKMCSPGSIYTDELFQPVKKNLCPVDNYGRWSYPEGIEDYDVEGWEKITWARAENIFNSKNYQVFYEGISADDIIQGGLGDCYFLSAVAALCKFPKLIERLFYIKEKSSEHCYGCYYRINGLWQLVLVDDYIPCYGSWGKNFAFTSTNGHELWVILLEKAWAKLNGNYAKSIGGEPHEVFDVITNTHSEKIRITSAKASEIWDSLINAEKRGFIMTAGTSGDTYNLRIEENGLVPGHAYTLLGVREVNTGSGREKLVHIRNPWGNGEWSGDWCDTSRKWTSDIKKQVGFVKNTGDGSFWMSYQDFITYYLVIGICHLYDDYVYSYLHVPKAKTHKGAVISRIEVVNSNTHAYIQLHQKNPRIALKDGTYQNPVINYLMLVDKNNRYVKANGNGEMENAIEVTLDKGTYYLISDINFRYISGQAPHCYNLSCYSSSPVGIYEEKNKDIKQAFREGIFDYCKKNIQGQEYAKGVIYQSKKQGSEFPFNFILFDNSNGQYDVTLTDTLVFKNRPRNADFYLEGNNEKAQSISKTVYPGGFDLFAHLPYTYSSLYSYELKTSAKAASGQRGNAPSSSSSSSQPQQQQTQSTQDIANQVFAETPEKLDQNGYLKQYVHRVQGGYYIGFENGSNRNLNMKLCLEGMYEVNNPNLSEVPFVSNGMTRKMFLIKPIQGHRGGISFLFDYA